MPNYNPIFKISIGIILAILGFTVGMIFLGILLIEIFGPNEYWIWFGGVSGSILSVYSGFKILLSSSDNKTTPPYNKHKQVKKGL